MPQYVSDIIAFSFYECDSVIALRDGFGKHFPRDFLPWEWSNQ